ncbi:MAG: TolC family protein [Bryobacteraceae bacterium]
MKKLTLLFTLAWWGQAERLELQDVLDSVTRHYPPLAVALAERELAEAELLMAQGKFDLTLRARADADRFGYYENERLFMGVEQATTWNGAGFYGGWRVGDGRFAPYEGKLDTRSYGEWSAGMKLPLLRDRAIDSKRADLRKAEIGRRLASLSIDQQLLVIRQSATRRYWDWVAAAKRVELAQAMLDIAAARDHFLRESAQAGQVAAIEVTENARAILQRRSFVVEAERALQQAAIELSLFYRDANGEPVLLSKDRAPEAFPSLRTIDETKFLADVEAAIRKRPDLLRVEAQRDRIEVDRKAAMNDRLPGVDFQLGFTAESGRGDVRRGPNEMKAALVFDLPLQRRTASGKLRDAEVKLRQVAQRGRFARDQVAAEVRDAASAVRAAHERAALIEKELTVARELEEAERARFQLGDGTLFLVNLREQISADTANRHIGAVNDYFRTWAQYEYAVAAEVPMGVAAISRP